MAHRTVSALAAPAPTRSRAGIAATAIAAALAAPLFAAAQTVPPVPSPASPGRVLGCALVPFATGTVAAVVDARTLRFADGREVLLAAIDVPPDDPAGPGRAARSDLEALTLGRSLVLSQAAPQPDRWGRLVGYAGVDAPEGPPSLQHALLARGFARVAARVEETACLPGLRAAEREARAARRGLWADPAETPRAAERPAEILLRRGKFVIVDGRPISVRESGGTIYLNFGRRWTEDFAATIPKKSERSFVAAGLDPKRLTGQRLEIRGIVEQRGGPRIEVLRPEQITVAGGR